MITKPALGDLVVMIIASVAMIIPLPHDHLDWKLASDPPNVIMTDQLRQGHMIFNPEADLDTSRIDDLRGSVT